MIFYVSLSQFDEYQVKGKAAFNSLPKALQFINNKGKKKLTYKIKLANGLTLNHTPLSLPYGKEEEMGIKEDDFRHLVHLDQEYLYDNRVNNIYDPFRIDPSSIHIY